MAYVEGRLREVTSKEDSPADKLDKYCFLQAIADCIRTARLDPKNHDVLDKLCTDTHVIFPGLALRCLANFAAIMLQKGCLGEALPICDEIIKWAMAKSPIGASATEATDELSHAEEDLIRSGGSGEAWNS